MVFCFWFVHALSYFLSRSISENRSIRQQFGHSIQKAMQLVTYLGLAVVIALNLLKLFGWYLIGTYTDWFIFLGIIICCDFVFIALPAKGEEKRDFALLGISYNTVSKAYRFVRKGYLISIAARLLIMFFIALGVVNVTRYDDLDPVITIPIEDAYRTDDLRIFDSIYLNETDPRIKNFACRFTAYKRYFPFKKKIYSANYCARDLSIDYTRFIGADSLLIGNNHLLACKKNGKIEFYKIYIPLKFVFQFQFKI